MTIIFLLLVIFIAFSDSLRTHTLKLHLGSLKGTLIDENFEFNQPRWHRSMGARPVYKCSNPLTSKDVRVLPIFPLDDGCALPTCVMPLNIFAMPYRTMMNDIVSKHFNSGSEQLFGIVMSDGKGGLAEIGTSLEIVERVLKPDGRQLVSSVSRQRFKILRVVQEEPYITCEVEYGIEDVDIPPSESVEEISAELSNLENELYQCLVDIISLSNSLEIYGKREPVEMPDKISLLSPKAHVFRKQVASLFSFAISDFLFIDNKERQVLLQSSTLEHRLKRIKKILMESRQALLSKMTEKAAKDELGMQ